MPEGIVYENDVEMGYVTEIEPAVEKVQEQFGKSNKVATSTLDFSSLLPDEVVRNECYVTSSGGG